MSTIGYTCILESNKPIHLKSDQQLQGFLALINYCGINSVQVFRDDRYMTTKEVRDIFNEVFVETQIRNYITIDDYANIIKDLRQTQRITKPYVCILGSSTLDILHFDTDDFISGLKLANQYRNVKIYLETSSEIYYDLWELDE